MEPQAQAPRRAPTQAVLVVGQDTLPGPGGQPRYLALARAAGLTLLRRAVRAALRAGAEQVLVLGPEDPGLRAEAEQDPLAGRIVRYLPAAGPLEQATRTLADAAGDLPEVFWLAAVDRLLSPAHFPAAAEGGVVWGAAAAGGVRPVLRGVRDRGEAVGVYLARRRVLARCGEPGPLQRLVQPSDPGLEVTGAPWQPVREPADLRAAQERVLRSLRKPLGRNADGLAAYYINRPLSLRISRALVDTAVTPNHVTALGLVVGLAAAALAAQGSYPCLLAAALLLQLSSVLDGVDGELARMRLAPSHAGEWFDTVCDDVINISFMAGLGLGCHAAAGGGPYLAVAGAGVVSAVAVTGFLYRALLRDGLASHNHFRWGFEGQPARGGLAGLLRPLLVGFAYLAKRDSYTVLLGALLALGLQRAALLIMSGGAVIIAAGTLGPVLLGALRGRAGRAARGAPADPDPGDGNM